MKEERGLASEIRDGLVVGAANRILRLATPWYRKRADLIYSLGREEYLRRIEQAAEQER